MTVLASVVMLTLGCLHTFVHRSGHYGILNEVASMVRPLTLFRLFETLMLPLILVGVVYYGSDASGLFWGPYLVFLLYVLTVMVRARRPTVRRGTFAMARG